MNLGSLFDGIGGFPVAALLNGIKPVWASEIEAAPVSITKRHLPRMEHLGDITKINGAEIEAVDIITFGSPCQDLSLAGNRKGLAGARSGLFMEAVRIIKEMRNKTHGKYPAFAVWENVNGAFSSNGGEDFRVVLEAIANITEPGVSIPRPSAGDGWLAAGAVMGDNWSLAWRVLDAQYWGVPQRRKRIFLVADFRGQRAGAILFKSESLPGNTAEGGKAGEGTAGDTSSGFGETGIGYWQKGIQCLRAEGENRPSRPSNVIVEKKAIGIDGYNQNITGNISQTLRGGGLCGDNVGIVLENSKVWPEKTGALLARADSSPCIDRGQSFVCYDARGNGDGKIVNTLTGDHENRVTDYTALAVHQNQCGEVRAGKVANTLNTNGNATGRNSPLVAFRYKSFGEYKEDNTGKSLLSCDDITTGDLITADYKVRRLTPTECERLMGFPDGWTEYGHDGKKISDSARYRALGNSVAIPCVERVLRGIKEAVQ